ncbi:MAG: pyridoxal-phosphate dependent enzyme [Flavobacteriaceae bacterium]
MISIQNQLLNNYFQEYLDLKSIPQISIKREDQIHPFVSGNKYRKLKYNLIEAKVQKKQTLLTFGGAFSNHIAATAAAGREYGIQTIGVIRGEELIDKIDENPTLAFAKANGMKFHFVSRAQYQQKHTNDFQKTLIEKFGDFYLLPEGGTNSLAVKGCEEILKKEDAVFDYICLPVGTGGTMAGIINSSKSHQKIIGFSALKGNFLENEIKKWTSRSNWEITDDYCFGGYAKINQELVNFINEFKNKTDIPLDPIYTGKMIYGIFELVKSGFFPKNSRILAIHTGGLQGIQGMNLQLEKRNLPLIEI